MPSVFEFCGTPHVVRISTSTIIRTKIMTFNNKGEVGSNGALMLFMPIKINNFPRGNEPARGRCPINIYQTCRYKVVLLHRTLTQLVRGRKCAN